MQRSWFRKHGQSQAALQQHPSAAPTWTRQHRRSLQGHMPGGQLAGLKSLPPTPGGYCTAPPALTARSSATSRTTRSSSASTRPRSSRYAITTSLPGN